MALYAVSFDIDRISDGAEQREKGMEASLEGYADKIRVAESSWLIRTPSTGEEIRDELKSHVGKGGHLIVSEGPSLHFGYQPYCGADDWKEFFGTQGG